MSVAIGSEGMSPAMWVFSDICWNSALVASAQTFCPFARCPDACCPAGAVRTMSLTMPTIASFWSPTLDRGPLWSVAWYTCPPSAAAASLPPSPPYAQPPLPTSIRWASARSPFMTFADCFTLPKTSSANEAGSPVSSMKVPR
jgi:hypothetical protein